MRWVGALLLFGFLVFAAGAAPSLAPAQPREEPRTPCVTYWGEARYVVGYNHYVHIFNGCETLAICAVSSSVNPNVQMVAVAPQEHAIVTTWLGSPASTFIPYVSCTLQKQ